MSKLKTVWDAVNELRGVLSLSKQAKHHTHLASCRSGAGVYSVYASDVRSELVVCTIAEFNALVVEMKLNFGNLSLKDYLDYYLADKVLLEKEAKPDYTSLEFWKDAPDDATHYILSKNKFGNSDFVIETPDSYKGTSEGISYWPKDEITDDNWVLIQRPQSTPTETPEEKEALDSIINKPLVYTQEMVDNGELPSVGMECMAKRFHESDNGLMISFIIGTNKELDYMVFERNNKLEQHHIVNGVWEFSPIDTRTKKEKAIDEFMAENLKGGIAFKYLISKAYDEWVGE